jgi:hypothetical protein
MGNHYSNRHLWRSIAVTSAEPREKQGCSDLRVADWVAKPQNLVTRALHDVVLVIVPN